MKRFTTDANLSRCLPKYSQAGFRRRTKKTEHLSRKKLENNVVLLREEKPDPFVTKPDFENNVKPSITNSKQREQQTVATKSS